MKVTKEIEIGMLVNARNALSGIMNLKTRGETAYKLAFNFEALDRIERLYTITAKTVVDQNSLHEYMSMTKEKIEFMLLEKEDIMNIPELRLIDLFYMDCMINKEVNEEVDKEVNEEEEKEERSDK